MPIYIADLCGVLLQVEYTLYDCSGLAATEYQSVRLLDADYKPCGPELLTFMHTMTTISSRQGPLATATPVLSLIGDEICRSLPQKN
jgi:hypothetical protein